MNGKVYYLQNKVHPFFYRCKMLVCLIFETQNRYRFPDISYNYTPDSFCLSIIIRQIRNVPKNKDRKEKIKTEKKKQVAGGERF
jgi:hypothetical protein